MRAPAIVPVVLAVVVVTAGCERSTVLSLDVGDCFQQPTGQDEVTDLEVVDCDEPHDHEVFHVFDLPGDEFPEEAAMNAAIDEACFGEAFEAYIGQPYETSEVAVNAVKPTQASWEEADDREVACAAYVPGEELEGSLQGSGR